MIGYVVKRTGKVYKKKLGFMKAKRAEIVVIDTLDHTHTLSRNSGKVIRYMEKKYGTLPHGMSVRYVDVRPALDEALTHTLVHHT